MKYKFGEKIRQVRERKGFTLKEVAQKTGVSESMVSQIERNKVSPAIDTLLNLADVLAIDIEYLFSDYKKEKTVNLVRLAERKKIIQKDVVYEQLSKTIGIKEEHSLEAFYMEVKAGAEKGSHEYGHVGRELGIIIEGQGAFQIGNQSYEVAAGDSISFASDVPHVLTNTGKKTLKAYWVVTPPHMFSGEV